MEENNKYITLRDAAQLSGYTQDYIGQLIRKGKLPGKQVFNAVAWMTTEEAIKKYIAENKESVSQKSSQNVGVMAKISHCWNELGTEAGMMKILKGSLYAITAMLAVFMIVLFYALSVSMDKKFQQKALENIPNVSSEQADNLINESGL
jgi:hypothetical protein